MIKVVVTKIELVGIQCPESYIQSKLRKYGIPISGFFSANTRIRQGTLTKNYLSDDIIEYIWSQDDTRTK